MKDEAPIWFETIQEAEMWRNENRPAAWILAEDPVGGHDGAAWVFSQWQTPSKNILATGTFLAPMNVRKERHQTTKDGTHVVLGDAIVDGKTYIYRLLDDEFNAIEQQITPNPLSRRPITRRRFNRLGKQFKRISREIAQCLLVPEESQA